MTTLIDVESSESCSVAMIDFENIRLSFELNYPDKQLLYIDFVHIILLAEKEIGCVFDTIYIFATDIEDLLKNTIYRIAKKAKLENKSWTELEKEIESNFKYAGLLRSVKVLCRTQLFLMYDDYVSKQKEKAISDNIQAKRMQKIFEKSQLKKLRETCYSAASVSQRGQSPVTSVPEIHSEKNVEDCSGSDLDSDVIDCISISESDESADSEVEALPRSSLKPASENFSLLTVGNTNRKIRMNTYKYKLKNSQSIQRGVDVGLAVEIVKSCFNPLVENVCLFSGDSDFLEVIADCRKANNVGGVIKFSKQAWVFGFSSSMVSHIQEALRASYNGRKNINDINFVCLYKAFPEILASLQIPVSARRPDSILYRKPELDGFSEVNCEWQTKEAVNLFSKQ